MKIPKHRASGDPHPALRDPLLLTLVMLCSVGVLAVVVVMAGGTASHTKASVANHGETVVTAGPNPPTPTRPQASHPAPRSPTVKKVVAAHPTATKAPAAVPVPTITHVVPGDTSSSLTWASTAVAGSPAVSGYNVYVGIRPGVESSNPNNGKTPVTTTNYVVQGLTTGVVYYFTVKAVADGRLSSASNEVSAVPGANYEPIGTLPTPIVAIAAAPDGGGYWLANYQGAVSALGSTTSLGSTAGMTLTASICQIVATSDGQGYWEVARDGGVFAFGDAQYYGSAASMKLNAPIVGMAATSDDKGYWEVARDGGVFAFGDAQYFGSMAGKTVNRGISAIAADPATGGYWELSLDGGIFAFNAPFLGTAQGHVGVGSVVGMAVTHTGEGYWEVADYGGVFAFGDAEYQGSLTASALNAPVAGIAVDRATGGYWLVGSDGGVFAFGAPQYGGG
ncbi:MAG: fibronectin type III domain-containing protein [Acidimicrobiales bacterium]|jgi:hypothetical protein